MKRFLTVLSLFLLFAGIQNTWAMDMEGLRRTVSANQSVIKRFQKEYDILQERQKSEELPPESKARMQDLENKIHLLIRENERSMAELGVPESDPGSEQLRYSVWLKMTRAEKEQYAYRALGVLENQGVFLMKPSEFYIETMDQKIAQDPTLAENFLDNMFLLNVFENEPQARETIKKMFGR